METKEYVKKYDEVKSKDEVKGENKSKDKESKVFFTRKSRSPERREVKSKVRKSPDASVKGSREYKPVSRECINLIDKKIKEATEKYELETNHIDKYISGLASSLSKGAKNTFIEQSNKEDQGQYQDEFDMKDEKYQDKDKEYEDIDFDSIEDDYDPVDIIPTDDIDFSKSDDLCAHTNVTKDKGYTICQDCGIELYEDISHEQEWRYFGDQDNRGSSDPSRCQYRKAPEKGIKNELSKIGFPPDICDLADKLYLVITQGEIKRSELRRGIMFATVFEAYKIKGRPKVPQDIQVKIGINKKTMSQGLTHYKTKCPREYFNYEEIDAKNFIPQIMNKLNIKQEHIDKVLVLYDKIKNSCSIMNRSNPQSASKSLIYYYLRRKGCNIHPQKYGKIVQLSEIIILRISGEISRILGTLDTVKLT